MTLPLVSIIIPSYKPKYFDLALRSAITQTYENIEIIVTDDCPDDAIYNIVEKYKAVKNIKYVRNPNPDGLGETNFENGLKESSGEYIKFLFDDDLLMPFCVQYMVEAFITNQALNPRLVVSERWFIDGDDRFKATNRLSNELKLMDITDQFVERYMALTSSNRLGEFSTAMWRREDSFADDGRMLQLSLDGRYMRALVDVAMWINLSRRGRVLYIPLPLSCFRQHEEANSSKRTDPFFYTLYTDWEIVAEQAFARGLITKEELATSFQRMVKWYQAAEPVVVSLKGHAERLSEKIAGLLT